MKACYSEMSASYFFFTCAFLYVYPLFAISNKWFKSYWFYSILFLVISLSFWAYCTNGIRNGFAGSLCLLGISREKRISQIFIIIIAIGFHQTILLPAVGCIISQLYNKPKHLKSFWILCTPLFPASGGFWEMLFANLGFDDERLSYLIEGNVNNVQF